ncbi:MAG: class II aldolase/adducin family protein [Infirmifilum sp.]
MLFEEMRRQIVEAFRFLEEKGLNYGYSGNISLRAPQEGLFLISPSGARKSRLRPEDILVIDSNLNVVEGEGRPSVETRTHLAVYRARKDVKAVVHAHSPYASVLAALRRSLPPILEETVIYLGGEVKVAEYAVTGSEELAENVVRALGERNAVILANHGALACGSSLDEALDSLVYLERAAKTYILASLLGEPVQLPREAYELELQMFRSRRQV